MLKIIPQVHTCQGCERLQFQHTAGSSRPQKGNSLKASLLENKTHTFNRNQVSVFHCLSIICYNTNNLLKELLVSRSNETAWRCSRGNSSAASSVAYLHTKFTDSRLVRYEKYMGTFTTLSLHEHNKKKQYIKLHYWNKNDGLFVDFTSENCKNSNVTSDCRPLPPTTHFLLYKSTRAYWVKKTKTKQD